MVIIGGGEYKCRVSKMHLKLRDQQLKTSTYKYKLVYKNLMVTEKQKSIIDIHRKKKSKHNTKNSQQIKREQNKGRMGKKDLQKQIQNN